MKTLLLAVNKGRQFLIPVSKSNIGRVKIEVLDHIIVRIDDLLKTTTTLERKVFVEFIDRSNT